MGNARLFSCSIHVPDNIILSNELKKGYFDCFQVDDNTEELMESLSRGILKSHLKAVVPRRENTAGPSDRMSAGTPPQALLLAADHSRRAVGARVRALSSIQLSCSHSDSAGKAQGLEWSWELLTRPLWSGNPQPAPLIQGCVT